MQITIENWFIWITYALYWVIKSKHTSVLICSFFQWFAWLSDCKVVNLTLNNCIHSDSDYLFIFSFEYYLRSTICLHFAFFDKQLLKIWPLTHRKAQPLPTLLLAGEFIQHAASISQLSLQLGVVGGQLSNALPVDINLLCEGFL